MITDMSGDGIDLREYRDNSAYLAPAAPAGDDVHDFALIDRLPSEGRCSPQPDMERSGMFAGIRTKAECAQMCAENKECGSSLT